MAGNINIGLSRGYEQMARSINIGLSRGYEQMAGNINICEAEAVTEKRTRIILPGTSFTFLCFFNDCHFQTVQRRNEDSHD
jgi:hypothetical protein